MIIERLYLNNTDLHLKFSNIFRKITPLSPWNNTQGWQSKSTEEKSKTYLWWLKIVLPQIQSFCILCRCSLRGPKRGSLISECTEVEHTNSQVFLNTEQSTWKACRGILMVANICFFVSTDSNIAWWETYTGMLVAICVLFFFFCFCFLSTSLPLPLSIKPARNSAPCWAKLLSPWALP